MNPAIFISYRRSDAGGHAGRLFDRLRQWFDAEALFYDQSSIDVGDVFPAVIEAALDKAAVMLVLIGPDWLDEINRRADMPKVDFVRCEVVGALARGTKMIPVLLGGAQPFDADCLAPALQAELAGLSLRNVHAFQGPSTDYDNQFVRLRHAIAAVSGVPAPRFRLPGGGDQPRRVIDHQISPHFQDPNALLPRLHAQLTANGSTALVARAALYGMGGIGKTQLALKYSLDYPDAYAGLWWFRAETDTTLQLDAEECCKAVGVPIAPRETPSAALKRWLDRQTAPWLLVYDNAENAETLRPHLPQSHTHRIVVTSRDPAWGGLFKQALELETWSDEQGAAFLAERLPKRDADELRALSADLGGLPLALEQAAGYIESTGAGIAAYRQLLSAVDTEGLILDEGRAATGYERSVLATLSLAFANLSPAAAQLLGLLAYAAPEPLLERFVREAKNQLPAELAAVTDDLAWNGLVRELRRYGLAERRQQTNLDDPTRTEHALHLHRLTQQALRARLAEPTRDGVALQAVLHAACPADAGLPANWPRYAALLPHVVQLDRYLDSGWLDRRCHSWLLDRIATYLQDGLALYGQAERWFRRALEIDCAVLGDEHPDTLISMGNLARTLRAQRDLSGARTLQEQVLALHRRVLADEHPDMLTSMNNLSDTLWAQGELPKARALQEQALAGRRRVLGDEHPVTLTSMNNLAEVLRAQGDLAGARTLHEEALEVFLRVLGDEHPDTLTSMSNLALTVKALGDLAAARALDEQVLAIRRRVFGDEHPDTLTSMNNLAFTLWNLGEKREAIDLMRRAAEGHAAKVGKDHPTSLDFRQTLEAWARQLADSGLPTSDPPAGDTP